MFGKKRYVTRGVNNDVPLDIQMVVWSIIDERVRINIPQMDYFQVFELSVIVVEQERFQRIVNFQEMPKYKSTVDIWVPEPIQTKLWVIDSEEYCTMLFPSEY